jgi:hypothetical protein
MAAPSQCACIIDIERSDPNVFPKDQRPYKFEHLNCYIECPVDFEGLAANKFPEIKTHFERQSMMYYFDILNGPSYLALIKEFWMKPTVVTKSVYLERIKAMVAEKPELEGKTPAQMGLRPFAGTKIE